eukprot:5566458-Amphidinium_carterae.1
MSFGTEGVKAWVSRVSKVGSSLNDSDSDLLLRVVEGSKAFMKSYGANFVVKRPDLPLLVQLSGDCTPVSLRSSHTHVSGKHKIKATGRETMELFVSQ